MAQERKAEQSERYAELIAAVHRGCEGLDGWAAQCIVAAVVPVIRRHISSDLRDMCNRHGLPCVGDGCPCNFAATVATGIVH